MSPLLHVMACAYSHTNSFFIRSPSHARTHVRTSAHAHAHRSALPLTPLCEAPHTRTHTLTLKHTHAHSFTHAPNTVTFDHTLHSHSHISIPFPPHLYKAGKSTGAFAQQPHHTRAHIPFLILIQVKLLPLAPLIPLCSPQQQHHAQVPMLLARRSLRKRLRPMASVPPQPQRVCIMFVCVVCLFCLYVYVFVCVCVCVCACVRASGRVRV